MIQLTVGELYDRCVQQFGDNIAITHGSDSFTYSDLGAKGNSIARSLQDAGVEKGETIAFLMANCPEYIFCEYALAKIGAIRVPLAVLLNLADHVDMMNQAECTTLIYHHSLSDRVEKMIPDLQTTTRFICVGGTEGLVDGHIPLSELMNAEGDAPDPVAIDPEDLAGIYFTGGTTGRPKGVMLSHRSWIYTYLIEMLEYEFAWGEVFLFTTPLTHAGGCLILPVLLRKGRCVIMDHFEPELFMQAVLKDNVSATFLVPTMIYMLLDHPARDQYEFGSLKNVIYGASAIAPERLRQALDVFGPIFTQLFGQTEAPMTMTVLSRREHVAGTPERQMRVLSSAGRPTFHAEIRLLDDNGQQVGAGETGEIVVRCANMMSGYLNNPEATAQTIRDGWLYTGDIATMDEEGFLYIVDRKKDMIVSGGFNVYPREIEDVLHEHAAVKGVAVVGVPDERWGEAVCAVVELHDNAEATSDALINFVKERKGSLVAPKQVDFWDSIPLTNLGKIDKKAIRHHYWKDQTRRV
jgi:acyl-CoA synthetase (AMP-forming)/AMP-acid ligase II